MGGRGHTSPSKPKLFTTGSGGSPSKLPIRPIASSRSMPSPFPPAVADKNGASTSRSKNKGKAVDDSSSRNKGKVVDDNSSRNNNYNSGRSGDTGGNIGQANAGAPREQDMFMPIANVTRIMRDILPAHAKISDDAKETMQECLSEYISFVTSEANERCRLEQRKTITAEDLLWSLSKLGFDDQVPPLTLYLQRYREAEGQLARGFLAPIKRTASDAGLYVQQQPAPQYPFMQPLGQYRNPIPPNIPQQPQTFFLRGGDGSSSLAAREQGLMPAPPPMRPNYHRPEAPAYSTGMQVLPAYSDAAVYRDITPAPSERDVRVYRGAAGASSSSQAADPLAQQAPFPGSDPYAPNK